MLKRFNWDGQINREMLDKFLEFLNSISDEDNVELFLRSTGGDVPTAGLIRGIINSERFTIIAYDTIQSSAFWLFFTSHCKKKMVPGCEGMYHQVSYDITVLSNGKAPGQVIDTYKGMKDFYDKETAEFMEQSGFTQEEKDRVNSGNDLIFSPARMVELLSRK